MGYLHHENSGTEQKLSPFFYPCAAVFEYFAERPAVILFLKFAANTRGNASVSAKGRGRLGLRKGALFFQSGFFAGIR